MEKEIESLKVPLGKSINITVEDNDENLVTQNRSQFDNCPGCDNFWDLEMVNCTMDDPEFIVICRPCGWMARGETIEQAMLNWNRRSQVATDREKRLVEALEQACRNTGHIYFNDRQTGRRLFWTEAGWELECHSSDKQAFIFATVLEALEVVDAQGEPLSQHKGDK